jgi:hypothetical protein
VTLFAVAATVLLGGGAYAIASSSSGTITICVSHKGGTLYKASKCKKHDKKLSWNRQGVPGPQGVQGVQGVQGPQGPGGSILTYDANASASSPVTTLGTLDGLTIAGQCTQPAAGQANAVLLLRTADGSLAWDYSYITNDSGTITSNALAFALPAGTLTSLTPIDSRLATAAAISNGQLEILQLKPTPGNIVVHETAKANGSPQTCHLSVMAFPTSIGSVAGVVSPATSTRSTAARGPIDLTAPPR